MFGDKEWPSDLSPIESQRCNKDTVELWGAESHLRVKNKGN
jgi:hypothetical protein